VGVNLIFPVKTAKSRPGWGGLFCLPETKNGTTLRFAMQSRPENSLTLLVHDLQALGLLDLGQHPQSCRCVILRQLPAMGGWRFCAFKGKVSWATTILFVRMLTFRKITGGLLIMKSG